MTQAFTTHLTRAFQREDIPAVTAISHAADPQVPLTVEGFNALEDMRKPEDPMQQWVIEKDGKVVAYARAGIEGIAAEGAFHFVVMTDPAYSGQGLATELLAKAQEFAQLHGASRLIGGCAEDSQYAIQWAEQQGFALIGKNAEVILDLTTPLQAPEIELPQATRTFSFLSSQEAQAAEPDFQQKLFETLVRPLLREIVLPGNATIDIDFATFQALVFDNAEANLDTQLLALHNGEYVGWCSCTLGNEQVASMDFLGIQQSFRGLDLELALIERLSAILRARGITQISTHLQVIPPYALDNLQKTGWIIRPGRLIYCKTLE